MPQPTAPLKRRQRSFRSAKPSSHKSRDSTSSFEEEDYLNMGFLEFCTVCEKQIPDATGNKTLYCSEGCRQKDTLETSPLSPTARTHSHHHPSFEITPPSDIVPQLSPTAVTHKPFFQPAPQQISPPESVPVNEDANTHDSRSSSRSSTPKSNTEAARYLQQFQTGAFHSASPRRRHAQRSSVTTGSVPSLSNSLTSSGAASVPYTPVMGVDRPLPPRNNPHSSSHSYANKSVDLVTPTAYCPTAPASLETITNNGGPYQTHWQIGSNTSTCSVDMDEHELLSYEKRKMMGMATSPGKSSLGQLLGSETSTPTPGQGSMRRA